MVDKSFEQVFAVFCQKVESKVTTLIGFYLKRDLQWILLVWTEGKKEEFFNSHVQLIWTDTFYLAVS